LFKQNLSVGLKIEVSVWRGAFCLVGLSELSRSETLASRAWPQYAPFFWAISTSL